MSNNNTDSMTKEKELLTELTNILDEIHKFTDKNITKPLNEFAETNITKPFNESPKSTILEKIIPKNPTKYQKYDGILS